MITFDDIGLPHSALIAMVHVEALPGTPFSRASIADLSRAAVDEATALADAGFDAIILENMRDRPYLKNGVGPEIVAAMTRIVADVRRAVDVPLGVQVLGARPEQALAVASAAEARFIRVENFAFSAVADEGLLPDAAAGPLLRYRRAIDAAHIAVFADVKKKHSSHALTADLPLDEAVRATAFFEADAVIVTGVATGRPVAPEDLDAARAASDRPVIVGSGAAPESVRSLLERSDAVIVGSAIKADGDWRNPVDPGRARAFVEAARD